MAGVEGWAKNILKVFMWMAWRIIKLIEFIGKIFKK